MASATKFDDYKDGTAVPKSVAIKAHEAIIIVQKHYPLYVRLLSSLISIKTVSTNEENLTRGIEFCHIHLRDCLGPRGWLVEQDAMGNLRCIPPHSKINLNEPVLWLCAHIDTVAATPDKWHSSNQDPFTCFETEEYLTGRGSNDCKAGVAFMLWYASLISGVGFDNVSSPILPMFNGGFLITRREEAGSVLPRSSPEFARAIVKGVLPISQVRHGTFIQMLENTVSIRTNGKGLYQSAQS